ncbi:MAG: DUF2309 domain-containing protein [Crocinitomicaceae bacterium]|nr:DUF2309 domain-containing protein [Crocinitomicaceae bacterium]
MQSSCFNEEHLLHELRHYLPAQAPLKDFVHHNTLHEFQHLNFHDGVVQASRMFGYRVYLSLHEYHVLLRKNEIKKEILQRSIQKFKGDKNATELETKLLACTEGEYLSQKVGKLRAHWKNQYHFDLNGRVHVNVFRLLNSYLDQGVALWKFPLTNTGLLEAVRQLEKESFSGFFRTERGKNLLHDSSVTIEKLLQILVGDSALFEHYVFDQQFEHPGWSGLVATIETQPQTLLDQRKITLKDLVLLELMLEIDTLDHRFGNKWKSLSETLTEKPQGIFDPIQLSETELYYRIWQDAYEWSYYDAVIAGLQTDRLTPDLHERDLRFQAMFCIDDREMTLREYIENIEPNCETFSTAGHFGIDTYFKPQGGKFYTKICPLPVNPKHIVCEKADQSKQKKDLHYNKRTHGLFAGWLIVQTVGFWSALKLFMNIFRPTVSPASASSFRHMDSQSELELENQNPSNKIDDLQIGYSIIEMTDRVESVLKSIGLVDQFAPLIYVIGHGASSTNNTHFSAYDCGACSGRPGSVNARVFSAMGNHPLVRKNLATRGINIPDTTQFLGGLHDTTTDEFHFYDAHKLTETNQRYHHQNLNTFRHALDLNSKERSRRFDLVNTKRKAEDVHQRVKLRAVSLFEPRPEYNHATNTLCIVGKRSLTQNLHLDRRAFLNSYDYEIDPDGKWLLGILNAAAPVCGGINLEYYFSRIDNHKLGAGSKLPHNVMGLIGVANGIEGDLRPGLPQQMIEIHDPLRLLLVVEHQPDVVLNTIKINPATYEWFINEWIHLVVVDPVSEEFYVFTNGQFLPYSCLTKEVLAVDNLEKLVESTSENLPVFTLKQGAL